MIPHKRFSFSGYLRVPLPASHPTFQMYLQSLYAHVVAGFYGTFVLNNDKERAGSLPYNRSESLWEMMRGGSLVLQDLPFSIVVVVLAIGDRCRCSCRSY